MKNIVILMGNLGQDPEIRQLDNGTTVAKFSVATNENYKDKNGEWQTETQWHEVVAWRYLADRAERDLKKGKLVYIQGKLTHRSYEDKDGVTRYLSEVVADDLKLLEKRPKESNFPSEESAPPAGNWEQKEETGLSEEDRKVIGNVDV